MKKELTKTLYVVQADLYLLLIKTHGYHWNVKGMNFSSLHILFEGFYTEYFKAVDIIAEHIRALNHPALGSAEDFLEYSKIKQSTKAETAKEMINDLIKCQELVLSNLEKACAEATKEKEITTIDLLNQRKEIHMKNVWMLKSHLE